MTTVLITGSEGNIGQFIVQDIIKKHPNFNLVRISRTSKETDLRNNDTLLIGDLKDKNFTNRIFKKRRIDYIIHAAAYPYSLDGFRYPYDIISNDIGGLQNILTSGENIKKIIYLSSILIYESSEIVPFTEKLAETIPPPKSPYGLAKHFCEKLVTSYAAQNRIAYTIWRPHNIISPLENHRTKGGHVYVDFYKKILVEKRKTLSIYGNGRQTRCFTWVEDLAEAIVQNLTISRTNNQTYNIGSEEEISMLELKDTMIKIGKAKKILNSNYDLKILLGKKFSGVDTPRRISSLKKINTELGWRAKTNFTRSLEKFIAYKQEYDV